MNTSDTARARRSLKVVAAAVGAGLVLSACQFDGVNSLALPGGVGTGSGSYAVEVELPDVGTLKPNAQVKVGDVAVGTVTALGTRNWHAVAGLRLGPDVRLPANAVAAVGQNSLLGASYLELAAPMTGAEGELTDGAVIPLARSKAYPTTEEVLAATSVVLNGSGLNQLNTITRELDQALGGDDRAFGRLLPQLDELLGGLDQQRTDITAAIDGLDRLAGSLAGQTDTITKALDELGPAFAVLSDEKANLVEALDKLRALSDSGSAVVRSSGDNLVANLRDLQPVLKTLADTQEHLVGSLGLLLSFPFPVATTANACKGDYCNLSLTIDLQLSKLDANLLGGTPLSGTLFGLQNALGAVVPGPAGERTDPLRGPLGLPGGAAGQERTPAPAPSPAPDDSGSGGLLGSLFGGGA